MRYETLIGWRYLYRRPATHGRLLLIALLTCIGTAVITGIFFLHAKQPPPAMVIGFTAASVGVIVCAVVELFSIFTSVSVFGVILGVASLTIVMSLTSGFQGAFQDKVLGVNAHVLVMRSPAGGFTKYRDVERIASTLAPDVVAVQPFVFVEMLITRGKGESGGIAMKGVDPERLGTVLDLPKQIIEGSIDDLKTSGDASAPPAIMIGRELAHKLKAKVGDTVTLVLPNLSMDPKAWTPSAASVARSRKFVVRGIFYSGFDEYDRRLVYIAMKEAQDFLGDGDVVTGVEMKLADVNRAREVARRLEVELKSIRNEQFTVVDWRELNNNLFTALMIQKIALLVILTLIIIVAAFNMVAALTMMVIDKMKAIAIMKSMGATSGGVAGVFQVVGMTIGGIGTALGLGLGLLLGQVVARYGYPLDPKVYLIDRLPIRVDPFEVALVGVITLVICFVATLYPALKASALRPVDGLRYE